MNTQKRKYELEDEIREIIHSDNKNSAHFEYSVDELTHCVSLVTLNKKTGATFLLTEAKGVDDIQALEKLIEYLTLKDDFHTFTIKWYEKGVPADRPFKSKFKARNIISAIEKFYYGRNSESLELYSISDDNIKSKDYEG